VQLHGRGNRRGSPYGCPHPRWATTRVAPTVQLYRPLLGLRGSFILYSSPLSRSCRYRTNSGNLGAPSASGKTNLQSTIHNLLTFAVHLHGSTTNHDKGESHSPSPVARANSGKSGVPSPSGTVYISDGHQPIVSPMANA